MISDTPESRNFRGIRLINCKHRRQHFPVTVSTADDLYRSMSFVPRSKQSNSTAIKVKITK